MNDQKKTCAVIIVTYNSQAHFSFCLEALKNQTFLPSQIIVIDSGSKKTDYLQDPSLTLHLTKKNIGFCLGNNIGYSLVHPLTDYILFLNPDTFLTSTFLHQAITYLDQPQEAQVGALSGVLLGFDIDQKKATGLIDSTGVFRSWFGQWFDRYQGLPDSLVNSLKLQEVPALCGALMFCRRKALQQVLLSPCEVMDQRFFMYKEDIDLSLRLRHKGWKLKFIPDLLAFHCRGWKKKRSQMAHSLRLLSAHNEMHLYARNCSPYYFISFLKYLFVKYFEK